MSIEKKMQHKYTDPRPTVAWDTECLNGYWSIGFKDVLNPERKKLFELYDGHPLDKAAIVRIFKNYRVVSFNGIHYDVPMTLFAVSGATNEELVFANMEIIKGGLKHWEFCERYGLSVPDYLDHIDLIQVAPSAARDAGKATAFTSLKMYAAMMHSKRMQDMPVGYDEFIDDIKRPLVRSYQFNDIDVTIDLFHELAPQIKLREQMSEEYDVDMRSKSDAQVGEAVIKAVVEKQTGRRLYKPDIRPGAIFYEAPAYVSFKTPELQRMLSEVLRARFYVRADGYVEPPDAIHKRQVQIGKIVVTMGIGGLHSTESEVSHFAGPDDVIEEDDVTGYYPNSMIASGREPANMVGKFQPVFRKQVSERTVAKKAGNKTIAESRKIVCNGIFGKTGSPYSIVYAPSMMIQTTVTGQLSLLMLMETATVAGFEVLSANTDGIVTRVPKARLGEFRKIVEQWEEVTQLKMEQGRYRSIHSKDVNNYVGIVDEVFNEKTGKWETIPVKAKRKGMIFTQSGRGHPGASGLKKNPDMEICADAVVEYLKHGTPVEKTIYECQDIRKFVVSRKVTDGAVWRGEPIGKTIRYYLCDDSAEPMTISSSGNKVPSSDWAYPCMELPEDLPRNINYPLYVREANALLNEIGMKGVDPFLAGRVGQTLARQEDQKTFHTINLKTGKTVCGRERKSIRDTWIEVAQLPEGHRHCKSCRDWEL